MNHQINEMTPPKRFLRHPPSPSSDVVNGKSSVEKMMLDLEMIRKLQVKEAVQARIRKMGEDLYALHQEEQSKEERLARERAAEALRQETALLAKLRHEEHLAATRHQQLTLEHEQSTKRVNEMLKDMEKKQKEAEEEKRKYEEKKQLLNKIYESQMSFRAKYQQIADATKSCKDRETLVPALMQQVAKLRNLCEAMEQMVKRCKAGDLKEDDADKSSALVNDLDDVLKILLKEVDRINSNFERNGQVQDSNVSQPKLPPEKSSETEGERKAGSSQQQVEEQPKPAQVGEQKESISVPKSSALDKISNELKDCVDPVSLKMYINLQNNLKAFEKSYEPLFLDERWKKFRVDCQKAVSTPVNAISPISSAHMMDKLLRLRQLLTGQPVGIGDSRVTSSAHPNGIAYCKNLLAKKLVKQGEQTVSSKPDAAFAIAAVIVALWNEFPDFGMLLIAHFHKECPYLVPFYIPQREGQSDEEYYKALGYRYMDDGTVEKQDKFLKRMSGIMRLYAAIIVTKQMRQYQHNPHPHGVENGWRWMAATLNLKPQPDICASLLFDFLEVAGNGMAAYYKSQFQKLLYITCKEYYPRLKEVTPEGSGGPVTRLQEFLQKTLRSGGFISPPEALISQPLR
ncbi:mRNA export factor GLE1 [Ischnura elegans]|uniref:mRNA export factor GLE1 n=1 Tax=Ischnura elegans TaxID=197161 RepID=UPI001ED8A690|nr:mRNA export factor GLE1 [Ischnura elegans]